VRKQQEEAVKKTEEKYKNDLLKLQTELGQLKKAYLEQKAQKENLQQTHDFNFYKPKNSF